MNEPNNDEVICPKCCEQFRAIPVNVQAELRRLRDERDALQDGAAIDELVAALKELLVVSVEPAGLTREIATDLDAFNHFMGIVESRVTAAVDSARAAIAKHDTPTKGETP